MAGRPLVTRRVQDATKGGALHELPEPTTSTRTYRLATPAAVPTSSTAVAPEGVPLAATAPRTLSSAPRLRLHVPVEEVRQVPAEGTGTPAVVTRTAMRATLTLPRTPGTFVRALVRQVLRAGMGLHSSDTYVYLLGCVRLEKLYHALEVVAEPVCLAAELVYLFAELRL